MIKRIVCCSRAALDLAGVIAQRLAIDLGVLVRAGAVLGECSRAHLGGEQPVVLLENHAGAGPASCRNRDTPGTELRRWLLLLLRQFT